MFERLFNRVYEMKDFPYFVPEKELDYNLEYAENMEKEGWINIRWREDVHRGGWQRFSKEAERIVNHGGLVLEICAGPGAGFTPAILMKNYNANIMISDLCPTVVKEWYKHFNNMEKPPQNIEFAAFNVCDMPFADNSIDVISACAAVINIEGDRDKGLREIYRVLKPGGLFVMGDVYITKEFYNNMKLQLQTIFKNQCPNIFWDSLSILDELGFSSIDTVLKGTWSNKEDESTLASFCREMNTELIFSEFTKYCIK
jgi:SAM-dependent methyltransferase